MWAEVSRGKDKAYAMQVKAAVTPSPHNNPNKLSLHCHIQFLFYWAFLSPECSTQHFFYRHATYTFSTKYRYPHNKKMKHCQLIIPCADLYKKLLLPVRWQPKHQGKSKSWYLRGFSNRRHSRQLRRFRSCSSPDAQMVSSQETKGSLFSNVGCAWSYVWQYMQLHRERRKLCIRLCTKL